MAFPTTEMTGYSDLRGRISLALGRCQEQPWLDFKESQPWPELQWRLLKTIMGMANLRDGGLILVGVSERGNTWELNGIEQSHLDSFDYDEIVDNLNKYASPQISVDIVIHKHDDGNRYLAFHVHQFKDSPVICRKNSPDGIKLKDRLSTGDIYVRPNSGKPQTVRTTDAVQLHDLLEMAAESRARKMLEVGKRVGLVPTESATSKFDLELSTIEKMPVPIVDYPNWRVLFRPEVYVPDLIPNLTECSKLVGKARVELRGWDFPHLATESNENHGLVQGSDWIGTWSNFRDHIEYWQLFQSGQFVHFALLREAINSQWKKQLEQESGGGLANDPHSEANAGTGYISLVYLVYLVTEYFEFAARICQAGVYQGNINISLDLSGVKGYQLTDLNWIQRQQCVATENHLKKSWLIPSENLIASASEHSLNAIVWLCECFRWIPPNVAWIRKEQTKLLSGRL